MKNMLLPLLLGTALSVCTSAVISHEVVVQTSLRASAAISGISYQFDIERSDQQAVQLPKIRFHLGEYVGESKKNDSVISSRRLPRIVLGVPAVGSITAASGDVSPLISGGTTDGDNDEDEDNDKDKVNDKFDLVNTGGIPPDAESNSRKSIEAVKERLNLDIPQRGVFFSLGSNRADIQVSGSTTVGTRNVSQLTIGYDQLLNSSTLLGALFDVSSSETDFDNIFDSLDDSADTTSQSVLVFTNYQHNELSDISGYMGVSKIDIDTIRFSVNSNLSFTDNLGFFAQTFSFFENAISGKSSGTAVKAGASFSKAVQFSKGVLVNTHADVDYTFTKIDNYTEDGISEAELRYSQQQFTTLSFRLGLSLSKAFSVSSGVLIPQLGIDIVNDTGKRGTVTAVLVIDPELSTEIKPEPIDEFYSLASIGVVFVNARRMQFFGKIDKSFAHSLEDRAGLTAGIRIAF